MHVIEHSRYAVDAKIPMFILLEVIEVLKLVDTDKTRHAAGRLAEFVRVAQTGSKSVRVSDRELMHLYKDVKEKFGFGVRFFASDAVEEQCGPHYIYQNKGSEPLRMGMLLGDLRKLGLVKGMTAGKGRSKWAVVDPDEEE